MADFLPPPRLTNRGGEVRKVGVEIEFSGVALAEAAEAVREAFGGELRKDHDYRYTVTTERLGEFEVAFDSALLRDKSYEGYFEKLGIHLGGGAKSAVEAVLEGIGAPVLPVEVSTPPIPLTDLAALGGLERALRERNALGTKAAALYAFALHFNPEAADPADPIYLKDHLRAFLLLYDWLFRRGDISWTRRVMPFIDPFPEKYTRLVIDPGYAPDMPRFGDDYVLWNPTRNRPLDMLPLIAWNEPDRLQREPLEGQPVTARPAFHYRLPNSQIDDPDWSIAAEWNRWVLVERLAARPDPLRDLSRTYLDWENSVMGYLEDRWVHVLGEEWVPLLLADPSAEPPKPGPAPVTGPAVPSPALRVPRSE
ncbi:MAG TPA: amidoligase family protein [Gemmataceae bacterium]